jgi:hypothetical protein
VSEAGVQSPPGPVPGPLMVAEYTTLREEIVKRIEIQHQLLSLTLLAAGALLGLGAQSALPSSGVTLQIYPILALFLAVAWAHNGARVVTISGYLEVLEATSHGELGWEGFIRHRAPSPTRSILAARGIFVTTQILALALAFVRNDTLVLVNTLAAGHFSAVSLTDGVRVLLFAVDCLAILYTLVLLRDDRTILRRTKHLLESRKPSVSDSKPPAAS